MTASFYILEGASYKMQREAWQIPRAEMELKVPGGLKSTDYFRGENSTRRKLRRAVEGPQTADYQSLCTHKGNKDLSKRIRENDS